MPCKDCLHCKVKVAIMRKQRSKMSHFEKFCIDYPDMLYSLLSSVKDKGGLIEMLMSHFVWSENKMKDVRCSKGMWMNAEGEDKTYSTLWGFQCATDRGGDIYDHPGGEPCDDYSPMDEERPEQIDT